MSFLTTWPHLLSLFSQGNSKGARLEEERNNQIMHENTILLNKLSKILTRDPEPVPAPRLAHGLNETHKRTERDRIDRENQALLRRLQDVRSSIDAEAAKQQYALHEALIRTRSETFVANPFLNATIDGTLLDGSVPRSRPATRGSASGGEIGTEVLAAPAPAPGGSVPASAPEAL